MNATPNKVLIAIIILLLAIMAFYLWPELNAANAAQNKKIVEYSIEFVEIRGNRVALNKFLENMNAAAKDGWRAKSIALAPGGGLSDTLVVLVEKEN